MVITYFSLLSPDTNSAPHQARANSFLNQYFVKFGWGWTFTAGTVRIYHLTDDHLSSPAAGAGLPPGGGLQLGVEGLCVQPGEAGSGDGGLVCDGSSDVSLC